MTSFEIFMAVDKGEMKPKEAKKLFETIDQDKEPFASLDALKLVSFYRVSIKWWESVFGPMPEAAQNVVRRWKYIVRLDGIEEVRRRKQETRLKNTELYTILEGVKA